MHLAIQGQEARGEAMNARAARRGREEELIWAISARPGREAPVVGDAAAGEGGRKMRRRRAGRGRPRAEAGPHRCRGMAGRRGEERGGQGQGRGSEASSGPASIVCEEAAAGIVPRVDRPSISSLHSWHWTEQIRRRKAGDMRPPAEGCCTRTIQILVRIRILHGGQRAWGETRGARELLLRCGPATLNGGPSVVSPEEGRRKRRRRVERSMQTE